MQQSTRLFFFFELRRQFNYFRHNREVDSSAFVKHLVHSFYNLNVFGFNLKGNAERKERERAMECSKRSFKIVVVFLIHSN